MDYLIKRKKAELDSTGYMEIGPGRYTGAHWQEGFVFIRDDAFGVAEGIVEKYFPGYDHLAMNEIPKVAVLKIISEWRSAADRLPSLERSSIQLELNLFAAHFADLETEIDSDRPAVAGFLRSLADECEHFVEQCEWMCILGM